MSIISKQKAEAERVKVLSESLDRNANDLEGLTKVLRSYQSFHDDDPVKHLKDALRYYVRDVQTT